MTQSAVSQQIAALEEAYDSILFRRRGRDIESTAEGKALYDWMPPIIAEVENFPACFLALKKSGARQVAHRFHGGSLSAHRSFPVPFLRDLFDDSGEPLH